MEESDEICPLCNRDLGTSWNRHHLVPRTFKGKHTVNLHNMCHSKIHSVFTERELLNYYNTIERILENEEVQKFVKWISAKPTTFHQRTIPSNQKRGRKGRR